jgi:cell division septation protein DedD
MPATPEDALSAPPAADRLPPAASQEPPLTAPAPSKLPPSIASAFAAAAYALQHGDPEGDGPREDSTPGQGLMPGLYASMLGQPSREYYLRLFERFDALGKGLPTWNLAAGLFTLPWCGLRGLWRQGALYALAAGGTAAAWILLRSRLGLPPAMLHGVDASLLLLAIAIPGLGANAVYWRHVRRHTLQAIGEAPTMAEAHERLARRAATPARKRLAVLAGAVLAAAAGATVLGLAVRASATAQTKAQALAQPATTVAEARLQPVADPVPAVPQSMPSAPATEAAASAATDMPRPPAPDPAPAGQMVSAAVEHVAPVAQPAPAPSAAAVPPAPAKAAAAAASTPVTPAAAAKASPAKTLAHAAKPVEPAKAAPKPAATLEPGHYYINIGVFSDAGNADRVVARLEKAQLPTLRQTLNSNKGEIVRVRSGPFSQQRRADRAAERIRKMGLEATVFHHTAQ